MAAYRLDLMTQDHPRIRGEHQDPTEPSQENIGSSPHTRGALWLAIRRARLGEDHPRIRGEHAQLRDCLVDVSGSSPHTRGARLDAVDARRVHGIIPAYAGSTYR